MLINLTFTFELNVSVKVGDFAYYAMTTPVGPNREWAQGRTPHFQADQGDIIMIGEIMSLTSGNGHSEIVCDMPQHIINIYGVPAVGSFIMFSKDNKVNLSSILGYYASVKYVNNSKDKSELFSVAADVIESSK